jgi:thymidylate synthase
MNNLDKQYQQLLKDIIEYGVEKKDRTGTGTKSIFGYTIRHNMKDGFPLLTTKKMPFKTIVIELLWFLRGDTNIKFLVDNNCHIWDGDAYKNYSKQIIANNLHLLPASDLPSTQEEFINKIKTDDKFAEKWGELGPVYGRQWRNWGERKHDSISNEYFIGVDQIANLINDLKTNPDSRRLMVNAWNVGELDQMVLPPCHYGFQVYTKELEYKNRYDIWFNNNYETGMEHNYSNVPDFDNEYYKPTPTRSISLMWNQRSVDTFLGLPFNIASYGLLLEIIAKEVNMVPDQLIGNLGDTHLYLNHIEQAKEQIGRKYTPEERVDLLRAAMGENDYQDALKELMPFGGGMSVYYDFYKIPNHTKQPYILPKLKHLKSDEFYKSLSEDASLFTHLDPTDFQLENYKSHTIIKAPLSN